MGRVGGIQQQQTRHAHSHAPLAADVVNVARLKPGQRWASVSRASPAPLSPALYEGLVGCVPEVQAGERVCGLSLSSTCTPTHAGLAGMDARRQLRGCALPQCLRHAHCLVSKLASPAHRTCNACTLAQPNRTAPHKWLSLQSPTPKTSPRYLLFVSIKVIKSQFFSRPPAAPAGPVENKLLAAVSICRRGPGQTCALGQSGPPNNDIYAFAPPVPK